MNIILKRPAGRGRFGLPTAATATSHMPLDDRYLQCGKTYGDTDERTERRPTCLTCREVFDKDKDRQLFE